MLGSAGSYIVTQLGLFVNFCRITKARGNTGRGLSLFGALLRFCGFDEGKKTFRLAL